MQSTPGPHPPHLHKRKADKTPDSNVKWGSNISDHYLQCTINLGPKESPLRRGVRATLGKENKSKLEAVCNFWYTTSTKSRISSSVNLDLALDIVVLAFEHIETLVRQVLACEQGLDVINDHLRTVQVSPCKRESFKSMWMTMCTRKMGPCMSDCEISTSNASRIQVKTRCDPRASVR